MCNYSLYMYTDSYYIRRGHTYACTPTKVGFMYVRGRGIHASTAWLVFDLGQKKFQSPFWYLTWPRNF
jgi:hypothetical protein